jgi:hypothetical protein
MKSRWILLLAIGAAPLVAHADWLPTTFNDNYIVTVGAAVNGSYGEITYSEDAYSGNFLPSVARDVYSITNSLSSELDSQVREVAAREQLNFIYGQLTGEANVTLQPNGAGYLNTRLSGLNYAGYASGTKSYGFLTGTCNVNVRVANIVATAQIGSTTGDVPESAVGLEADVSHTTHCSNNLAWVPLVGLAINIYAEHRINGIINAKTRTMFLDMKDKLFFQRDANAYVGLNRIVPADKVIPLPNGQSFAVGQWLQGQLTWILNNVNANFVLGHGAQVQPFPGWTMPDYWITGNVARFNLVVGGVTLNINMREEVLAEWTWYCNSWPCPEVP